MCNEINNDHQVIYDNETPQVFIVQSEKEFRKFLF
jgi:hypothetical protein